jgi:hypothetical protein
MTFLGGIGMRFRTCSQLQDRNRRATFVVALGFFAIAWIRKRFMDTVPDRDLQVVSAASSSSLPES